MTGGERVCQLRNVTLIVADERIEHDERIGDRLELRRGADRARTLVDRRQRRRRCSNECRDDGDHHDHPPQCVACSARRDEFAHLSAGDERSRVRVSPLGLVRMDWGTPIAAVPNVAPTRSSLSRLPLPDVQPQNPR